MTNLHVSFKEAAKRILKEAAEPLSPKEIVQAALERGLIYTEGATPDATMAAQLYVDIQQNAHSPFKKVGKGKFALKEQEESALSAELIIEKQNVLVRRELKNQLLAMDAYQFELLVGDLLKKLGYVNVQVTKKSGDKGIDVIADLTMEGITNVKTVVQVKRFKEDKKIAGNIVAQLRGSAEVDQRGLVITTSDFTKDALAEAKAPNKMPVALINGEKLVQLLIKSEVGVKKETYTIYSVDTDYFESPTSDELSATSDGKNRGLWPLPGGVTAYVDTLFQVLEAIKAGYNTRQKLIEWFMKNFDTVKSAKTSAGYVGVPRVIGVTKWDSNGKIELTPEGEKVLQTKDLHYLYSVFSTHVFAVEEIVEFLKTAQTPQDEESVLDFLRENLNVEWSTYAQVNFRLLWLTNLGKIKRTPEGYTL